MPARKKMTVKHPPRRGGSMMNMRSGFRKLTGQSKGKRISSGTQRTVIYVLGAIVIFALIFGLSQR